MTTKTEKELQPLSQKKVHDAMSQIPFMAKVRLRGDMQLLPGQVLYNNKELEGYAIYSAGQARVFLSHAPDPKFIRQYYTTDNFQGITGFPNLQINLYGWVRVVNIREIVYLENFDPLEKEPSIQKNGTGLLFWNGEPWTDSRLSGGDLPSLGLKKAVNGCQLDMVPGSRALTITLPDKTAKLWVNVTTITPQSLSDKISDCGSLGLHGNNAWLTYGIATNWLQRIHLFYLFYNLEEWLTKNTFLIFTGFLPSKYTKPMRAKDATLPNVSEVLETIASLGGVIQPLNHPRYDGKNLTNPELVQLPSARQHYLFLLNLNGLYHYYKSEEFQNLKLVNLHSL